MIGLDKKGIEQQPKRTYNGQRAKTCPKWANPQKGKKGVETLKIKEYAEEKNVSQNGLYKSIRRAGYSAKELTDKKGDITARGFTILNRIFPDGGQDQRQREPEKEMEQINGRLLELEKDREEQKNKLPACNSI